MKNLNELSRLRDVKAPDNLNARTFAAIREARQELNRPTVPTARPQPQHLAPRPRSRRSFLRPLATVCALGVVVGGVAVWQNYHCAPSEAGEAGTTGMSSGVKSTGDAVVKSLVNTFGFVAYAAGTGEIQPHDSKIVFASGSGSDSPEDGMYTGCLFRLTGDNIKTISASIDRGGLYRTKTKPVANDAELREYLQMGESPLLEGADHASCWGNGAEDIVTYVDLSWRLENGFQDTYDPDASYGFWLPPFTGEEDPNADLQAEWHARIDEIEGAVLTVTVTFTDDTTQTQTITLHTGKLGVEYPAEGSGPVLTGEVYDKPEDFDKPYLYGVYGEIQS